jgi:hypothetical protein
MVSCLILRDAGLGEVEHLKPHGEDRGALNQYRKAMPLQRDSQNFGPGTRLWLTDIDVVCIK